MGSRWHHWKGRGKRMDSSKNPWTPVTQHGLAWSSCPQTCQGQVRTAGLVRVMVTGPPSTVGADTLNMMLPAQPSQSLDKGTVRESRGLVRSHHCSHEPLGKKPKNSEQRLSPGCNVMATGSSDASTLSPLWETPAALLDVWDVCKGYLPQRRAQTHIFSYVHHCCL